MTVTKTGKIWGGNVHNAAGKRVRAATKAEIAAGRGGKFTVKGPKAPILESRIDPTGADFQKYLQNQQRAFDEPITYLDNALGRTNENTDRRVLAMQKANLTIPTVEGFGAAAESAKEQYMKDFATLNTGAGGAGVSSIVSGMGGGIGADAGSTADYAGAAGTISGQGGQGGNVYAQSLGAAGLATLAGTTQSVGANLAERRYQGIIGEGEARGQVQDKREGLFKELRAAKSAKISAQPNPLEIANMILQHKSGKISLALLKKQLRGSAGGTGVTKTPDLTGGGYKTAQDFWTELAASAAGQSNRNTTSTGGTPGGPR